MTYYQITLVSKLLVFLLVIPFTFRSVASLDPDKLFISRTDPWKKQYFYIALTLIIAYLISNISGFLLDFAFNVMLGV